MPNRPITVIYLTPYATKECVELDWPIKDFARRDGFIVFRGYDDELCAFPEAEVWRFESRPEPL